MAAAAGATAAELLPHWIYEHTTYGLHEDYILPWIELPEPLPRLNSGFIVAALYATILFIMYFRDGTHWFAMWTHGLVIPTFAGIALATQMEHWAAFLSTGYWVSFGYFFFLIPLDIQRFRPVFLLHHFSSLYLFYQYSAECPAYIRLVGGALVGDISSVWLGLRTHIKYTRYRNFSLTAVVDIFFVLIFIMPRAVYIIPQIYAPIVYYGAEVYDCDLTPNELLMVRFVCACLIVCNSLWISEILWTVISVYILGNRNHVTSADEKRKGEKATVTTPSLSLGGSKGKGKGKNKDQ